MAKFLIPGLYSGQYVFLFYLKVPTDKQIHYTLCRIRSHGTELITLERKLHGGTIKTKESRAGVVQVPLFWMFH